MTTDWQKVAKGLEYQVKALRQKNRKLKQEIKAMKFQQAFDKFMTEEFESAVDSSTKASWGGSGYSVELFEDGTYRVLWDNQIGNLYDSPGIILGIPTLDEEEWNEDEDLRFYDNAEEYMRDVFKEEVKGFQASQSL